MKALLEMAKHKYCLGGASCDEVIAAMIDACINTIGYLHNELTADADVPPLR